MKTQHGNNNQETTTESKGQTKINWLVSKKLQSTLENKLTQIAIKTDIVLWIELWGFAKLSNTKVLQTFI